jgi:hypothetical protein
LGLLSIIWVFEADIAAILQVVALISLNLNRLEFSKLFKEAF